MSDEHLKNLFENGDVEEVHNLFEENPRFDVRILTKTEILHFTVHPLATMPKLSKNSLYAHTLTSIRRTDLKTLRSPLVVFWGKLKL